jgi:hypothetical protein
MQRRSERDPHDPKGWRAHVDAHHAVCAVANDDDAQVHGCWWFLPWHRAFLAVTEWKLRAISGDPSLALPYWNWSSARTIPAAFALPNSPLARAARYTPDRPLTSVEVDHLLHDGAWRTSVSRLSVRMRFRLVRPSRSRAPSAASSSQTPGNGMGGIGLRAFRTPRSTTISAARPPTAYSAT